jgi:hypothetical protein
MGSTERLDHSTVRIFGLRGENPLVDSGAGRGENPLVASDCLRDCLLRRADHSSKESYRQ